MMPKCVCHHLNQDDMVSGVAIQHLEGHTKSFVSGKGSRATYWVVGYLRRFFKDMWTRRPGQGRIRKTIHQQDHYLAIRASWNWQALARSLVADFWNATQVICSDQTVNNRLHEHEMDAQYPSSSPISTRRHQIDRLSFAEEHLPWKGTNGLKFPSLIIATSTYLIMDRHTWPGRHEHWV